VLVLVLAGLELGLRAFWTGYYVKVQKAYAQPHPVRGWSNRPSVSVPYGEPEFSTLVTHNAFGYRGRAIERERRPGSVRVLTLGDSFAYGIGVGDDETFSAQLERLAPGLEVINTGVNGYGTGQELLLLRDEGLAFQPDVVLLSFFWNDIGNSYRNRAVHFSVDAGELVYPTAPDPGAASGPAVSADAAPSPQRRTWLRHSYAYRFLSDRLKLAGYWLRVALRLPLEESDFVSEQTREAAWQLGFFLLREIDRISRQAGARLVLLVIPDQVQVEPGLRVTGLEPADYEVQERLLAFAAQQGIPVVDPLPALRAAHAESGELLYYLRDRHLRARGHALVAREILERLRQLGYGEPGGGA
jgi:hypothetical protein